MKTLVLGLGNPILTDDGVGIYVVRQAAARWTGDGVDFKEAAVGGLRLLEVITGYERMILVDAIITPGGRPGGVSSLGMGGVRASLRSLHAGSTHDLSLSGALALGRTMGLTLPRDEDIAIVAVEVSDVLTFGETCTPAIAAAIPRAVMAVMRLLGDPREQDGNSSDPGPTGLAGAG